MSESVYFEALIKAINERIEDARLLRIENAALRLRLQKLEDASRHRSDAARLEASYLDADGKPL